MTTFEPPGGVGAGVGALLTMTADKASESVHEAADKADVATKSDATRRRAVKVKPAAPSATATACALAATKVLVDSLQVRAKNTEYRLRAAPHSSATFSG